MLHIAVPQASRGGFVGVCRRSFLHRGDDPADEGNVVQRLFCLCVLNVFTVDGAEDNAPDEVRSHDRVLVH